MNADKAREIFNEAIKNSTDETHTAKLELLREYACNPEFRADLKKYIYTLVEQRLQNS